METITELYQELVNSTKGVTCIALSTHSVGWPLEGAMPVFRVPWCGDKKSHQDWLLRRLLKESFDWVILSAAFFLNYLA